MEGHEGREASLSIEETNRLRISLGLKPLKAEKGREDSNAIQREEEQRAQREKDARARNFMMKQEEKRQKLSDDKFFNVKKLGDEDPADDMEEWVNRSRSAERKLREEREKKRRAEEERIEAEEAEKEERDRNGGYSSVDLAGKKVKHNYGELNEGETMVLTLADKGILGEKGQELADDEDELENVIKVEQKRRDKAREAAGSKAKPLWEEDGKKRTLLDKYDEEDAEVSMQIGEDGTLEAERSRQQAEMKAKLTQGGKMLDSAAVGAMSSDAAVPAAAAEYRTESAENTGFKKKRKVKKDRKIRAKSADPEEAGNTAALIEALEAEAEVRGAQEGGQSSELGSRAERQIALERAEILRSKEEAERRARFEAAVRKSNLASEELRPQARTQMTDWGFNAPVKVEASAAPPQSEDGRKPGEAPKELEEDEEAADLELQRSLARARKLAQQKQAEQDAVVKQEAGEETKSGRPKSSLEEIAELAAKKREQDEKEIKAQMKAGLLVNDTIEFVRNIQAKPEIKNEEEARAAAGASSVVRGRGGSPAPPRPPPPADDDDYMGLSADELRAGGERSPSAQKARGVGRWVAAEEAEGSASVEPDQKPDSKRRNIRQKSMEGGDDREGSKGAKQDRAATPDESVVTEKPVGKGLAGALSLLKEKGNLSGQSNVSWSGRTNDKSKNALQGLGDVYTGGQHEDRLARSIENALTVKDEFGNVMTPKERFRHLCYEFHGKAPSKNKQEKRIKQLNEEIARQKNATSEVTQHQELEGLRKATEKSAQPFVVLQGKGASETLKTVAASSKQMPPPSGGVRKVVGGGQRAGSVSGTTSSRRTPPPA